MASSKTSSQEMVKAVPGLSSLADDYALILCDVWGVIHNGIRVFDAAADALATFRQEKDARVILLTNAPRPAWWVANQLKDMGLREDAYDAIVTSGDVTRADIIGRDVKKVFALGPERDLNFYDDLPVSLVSEEEADLVVVTGLLDDETETPDDYQETLQGFLAKGLDMVCANPDIVVERGDRLVYCGGALAELYAEMGGNAFLFGKPHAPIYEMALKTGSDLCGRALSKREILAVGDGIATDVRGANNADLDCLFVTGGIHSAESGPLADANADKVQAFLDDKGQKAKAFLPRLFW